MWNQWKKMKKRVCIFILLGYEINHDGKSTLEIKRRITLSCTAMVSMNKTWKSKDITLNTKHRLVKTTVFPIMMYGCESWTMTKANRRKIDACIQNVVLEKIIMNNLDSQGNKQRNVKLNKTWYITRCQNDKNKTNILWACYMAQLIRKACDVGICQ